MCGCVHAIYIVSECTYVRMTMCVCITVSVLDTLAHAAFVVWCNVAVLDGLVTTACECRILLRIPPSLLLFNRND